MRYREADGYRFELYDLEADLDERTDLYPEQSAAASDLVALIESYEAHSAEMRAQISAQAGATEESGSPQGIQLDPELEEKIQKARGGQ